WPQPKPGLWVGAGFKPAPTCAGHERVHGVRTEATMLCRNFVPAMALLSALNASIGGVQAQDTSKYPDWRGAWSRIGAPRWDTSKPEWKQEPPLTAEYQAIYDANVADIHEGGQGVDPTFIC